MERRFSTRDAGLTLRMLAACAGVAVLAVCVAGAVAALCVAEPTWTPYVLVLSLAIGAATVLRYESAGGLMLAAVDAKLTHPDDEPRLHDMLQRMAALADVPCPRLAVVDSATPNAFTAGIRRADAVVVVTNALAGRLTPPELDAVVAHELAHVANRDAGVMTIASIPRTFGATIVADEGVLFYLWFFVWWVGLPIWAIGSLLTLALSRYREFAADRGSALLTGRPADLMSALVKLSSADEIPNDDLRRLARVEALWVVPNGRAHLALFADHPPLEQRLARLGEMSRRLGEARGA
jgi:heat shock protein HtpX